MSEYLPRPKSLGADVKVELDFSNYATKADLNKYSCSGPPAFKSGSCSLRFS